MKKKLLVSVLGCIVLLLVLSYTPKTQALLPNSFQVANHEYFFLKFTEVNTATEPINGFGLTQGMNWLIKFTSVNSTGPVDSIYGEVLNDSKYYTQGGDWVHTNIFPNTEFKMADFDSTGVTIPVEYNSSFVIPLVLPIDYRIYNDTTATFTNNLSTYWKAQFNATFFMAENFSVLTGGFGSILSLPTVLPEYVVMAWHGNLMVPFPFVGENDFDLLYITMYLKNGTLCYALCAQWFAASNWTIAYKLMTPWLELFDLMISGIFGFMFPGLPMLDMTGIPGFSIGFALCGIILVSVVIISSKTRKQGSKKITFYNL